jgi:hypothetical protein
MSFDQEFESHPVAANKIAPAINHVAGPQFAGGKPIGATPTVGKHRKTTPAGGGGRKTPGSHAKPYDVQADIGSIHSKAKNSYTGTHRQGAAPSTTSYPKQINGPSTSKTASSGQSYPKAIKTTTPKGPQTVDAGVSEQGGALNKVANAIKNVKTSKHAGGIGRHLKGVSG